MSENHREETPQEAYARYRAAQDRKNELRRLNRLKAQAERDAVNLLKKLTLAGSVKEKREIVKYHNPLFYSMGTKLDPRPDEVQREEEYERERKSNE